MSGFGCSTSATWTIKDPAHATEIEACAIFTGSIAVAEDFSGDLVLDQLQDITGSLNVTSAGNLTSISANALRAIGGSFYLQQLFSISDLSFPNLTATNELLWQTLGPYLQTLNFKSLNTASNFTILDTFLQNLEGIDLNSADILYISQNGYLTNISLPLTSSSSQIIIRANAQGDCSLYLPALQSAGSIDVENCTFVDFASLTDATGLLSFTGNSFSSLDLPILVSSDGLTIENNGNLTLLSLPVYTKNTHSLSMQNNTAFDGAASFPNLTSVNGDATFLGAFSSISMNALDTIMGDLSIESSHDLETTCDHFDAVDEDVVKGDLTCEYPGVTLTIHPTKNTNIITTTDQYSHTIILSAAAAGATITTTDAGGQTITTIFPTPTTSSTTSSSPSPSHTPHSTSTGAIAGGVVGGLALLAAITALILFWRRRTKRHRPRIVQELDGKPYVDRKPVEMAENRQRAELAERDEPVELEAPWKPVEMEGNHVRVERTDGARSPGEQKDGS